MGRSMGAEPQKRQGAVFVWSRALPHQNSALFAVPSCLNRVLKRCQTESHRRSERRVRGAALYSFNRQLGELRRGLGAV